MGKKIKELPWYKDTKVVKHRDSITGIVSLYDMHKDQMGFPEKLAPNFDT